MYAFINGCALLCRLQAKEALSPIAMRGKASSRSNLPTQIGSTHRGGVGMADYFGRLLEGGEIDLLETCSGRGMERTNAGRHGVKTGGPLFPTFSLNLHSLSFASDCNKAACKNRRCSQRIRTWAKCGVLGLFSRVPVRKALKMAGIVAVFRPDGRTHHAASGDAPNLFSTNYFIVPESGVGSKPVRPSRRWLSLRLR